MATWTKRVPIGSTTRRKWNLEDRASLNNLKKHFAADGCPEIQYDLARQLLESNSEFDEEASHAQGVYWLLRAAHQGHEEALQLLRECYNNRRGINDKNELEVKACLSMTPGERAARKAARELFACLSNGSEHITPAQLEKKMREIYKLQKKRCRRRPNNQNCDPPDAVGAGDSPCDISSSDDEGKRTKQQREDVNVNGHVFPSQMTSSNNDIRIPEEEARRANVRITEANLLTAAVNYARGQLPAMSEVLTLSVPNLNSLDHIPCFHRLIFHPIIFFTLLYHRFIRLISSFPSSIANSNLKLLILFLIYTLTSSGNLSVFIPLSVYYISFFIMIWATVRMLKTKHEFIDFRIWSGLFLSYGDNNLNAGSSENQFLRNNMKPYLYFFCAFIVNLMIYPLIRDDELLPNSEITVMSFLMVFLTMIAFMYTSSRSFPDYLILFSFGINVLAKYPYEMDSVVITGWRFLDLKVPTFSSFVIGNGIEFCLNCRAVLYLLIPGFLIQLAKRSNWHGTYTYLIPHCVTLSWLQICISSSQSATMFGLVRAALGLAGILLFLPLFGIVTLMIPIFVAIEWMGLTNPKIRVFTSLTAAGVAILVSCLMAINRRTQKYVTAVQVGVCIIAAALLTVPYMTSTFTNSHVENSMYENLINSRKPIIVASEDDMPGPIISWEAYYKYCDSPAWEHVNKIQTQLRCSELEGSYVRWEGQVSYVRITKVNNYRADLIRNYLPKWLGNYITCTYGEKNEINCSQNEDECELLLGKFFVDRTSCNLNKWNTYEYEIKVHMHSGLLSRPGEVFLLADDKFGNFTKYLNTFDRIWFRGRLLNRRNDVNGEGKLQMTLGLGQPVVDLLAIGCQTCVNKDLSSIQLTDPENMVINARMRDLMRGIKYLLNVLFNPLLTFK